VIFVFLVAAYILPIAQSHKVMFMSLRGANILVILGMKIITQSMSGASKILPKPTQLSGSPGTPVVVVNAGSSVAGAGNTTVTMVPKTVSSYTSKCQ
jgi:hypothetical protein